MKTLVLKIDNVRCEFEEGKLFLCPPFINQNAEPFTVWYKRNRTEIEHYKELTSPETAQQKKFIEKTDSDLLQAVYDDMMQPDELTFKEFAKIYQTKHRAKYGKELTV